MNEINKVNEAYEPVFSPKSLGVNIAENYILSFQIKDDDRDWLKTKEMLEGEQQRNTDKFQALPPESQAEAKIAFWERMNEAQKFLGERFWERKRVVFL